ncbi:MAG TPA: carboxypeptidase regulatory-like domain-containing protein, partial [Myxococcota bacterium]
MLRLAASFFVIVTMAVGCFSLERTRDIEPGSITGAAVDEAGARIDDVTISVEGTGQTRSSRDGSFHVAGLPAGRFTLRLTSDVDDDGVVDRGARLPFLLDVGVDERVGFVLCGDVVLPTTATIRGRVVDADGVAVVGARVVAAAIDEDVVSEAVAATDSAAGGFFVLEGVLAGAVTVVASAPGAASTGVGRTVGGGDDVDVGDVAVLPGGADVSVTVTTVPDVAVDAAFARRPDGVRTAVSADVVTVAPGVFDLEVAAAAGNDGGVLRDLALPRDRQALRVVIVLEGVGLVAPPDTRPGEDPGDPPDGGVEVPTDPEEPPPNCGIDVVITNGVYTPATSTLAGCADLRSLTITNGAPDLSALASLQSVRGDVVIENTGLTSLAGLTALRDAASIAIRGNGALSTLSLPALSSARTSLLLDSNGTQRLELPQFNNSERVELANMPALTAVTVGASPGVQNLLLRGQLGDLTTIYAAFN